MSSRPLPPGWEVHTSRSTGENYYFNTSTGATTYDFPVDSPEAEQQARLAYNTVAADDSSDDSSDDGRQVVLPPAAGIGVHDGHHARDKEQAAAVQRSQQEVEPRHTAQDRAAASAKQQQAAEAAVQLVAGTEIRVPL